MADLQSLVSFGCTLLLRIIDPNDKAVPVQLFSPSEVESSVTSLSNDVDKNVSLISRSGFGKISTY
jgi:hypothetical protein